MKERVSKREREVGGRDGRNWNRGQGEMNFSGHVTLSPSSPSSTSLNKRTASCLFGKIMFPWNACTMSSVSHSVPDPFRKTSSGSMGMIVHRAKMNGWTYFM